MSDDAYSLLWTRRHEVLYKLAVSYAYHRKRQRFFDLLDKGTKALTVLVGASLLGEPVRQYLPLVAGAISGLGLLSLVFGYGDRKQSHKEMAECFMQQRAGVDRQGVEVLTEDAVAGWESELARLCSREPPTLNALVTICQNEQNIALGHPESVHRLPWYQRLLANWCSFTTST